MSTSPRRAQAILRILAGLLAGALTLAQPTLAGPETLGPMLGAVEMSEAKIWLQSDAPARFRLRYWPAAEPAKASWSEAQSSEAGHEYALNLVLTRLLPGTRYRYRVERDGQLLEPEYGFTTQRDWLRREPAPDLRIALGSCVFLNDPVADPPGASQGGDYQIFARIAAARPDLMLWLGDNVYHRPRDYFARSGMSERYRQLHRLPETQALFQGVANYAIWDDHDYGDNDGDRSYRMRGDSQALFRDYWANPAYGPEGGIYSRFVWSDVEFFLTDNRSFRAPNRLPDPDRTFFGPAQLQWLKDSLSSSTATFKLILLGNQILNTATPSENFYSYSTEYKAFLDWLASSKIPGIVILSGDRHHSELLRLERAGTYPLYEWTVSPLTSKAQTPFEAEQTLPIRVPGSLLIERNFGLIEVRGPEKQRELRLRLVDAQGQTRWNHSLNQNELK